MESSSGAAMNLTKQQAIAIFRTQGELARALGITTSAVGQWPDVLDQRKADEVVGAALRLGKTLPNDETRQADVA
jgi:transcriptional repressor of cell division inhibition gene dicB